MELIKYLYGPIDFSMCLILS